MDLSIAVIVLYWIVSIGSHLLGYRDTPPAHVGSIALFVCVKTIIATGLIWLLLRARGERIASLGLSARELRLALPRMLLYAVAIFLIVDVAFAGVLSSLAGSGRTPALAALFRDPREAPLWVFSAVVGGGFTEELMRAFVLTRFQTRYGATGLVAALVIDTVEFGMGHLYQGVPGAIQAGATGLLFALIFLRRRRVADSMVAHALFDLIGVVAAYALYAQPH